MKSARQKKALTNEEYTTAKRILFLLETMQEQLKAYKFLSKQKLNDDQYEALKKELNWKPNEWFSLIEELNNSEKVAYYHNLLNRLKAQENNKNKKAIGNVLSLLKPKKIQEWQDKKEKIKVNVILIAIETSQEDSSDQKDSADQKSTPIIGRKRSKTLRAQIQRKLGKSVKQQFGEFYLIDMNRINLYMENLFNVEVYPLVEKFKEVAKSDVQLDEEKSLIAKTHYFMKQLSEARSEEEVQEIERQQKEWMEHNRAYVDDVIKLTENTQSAIAENDNGIMRYRDERSAFADSIVNQIEEKIKELEGKGREDKVQFLNKLKQAIKPSKAFNTKIDPESVINSALKDSEFKKIRGLKEWHDLKKQKYTWGDLQKQDEVSALRQIVRVDYSVISDKKDPMGQAKGLMQAAKDARDFQQIANKRREDLINQKKQYAAKMEKFDRQVENPVQTHVTETARKKLRQPLFLATNRDVHEIYKSLDEKINAVQHELTFHKSQIEKLEEGLKEITETNPEVIGKVIKEKKLAELTITLQEITKMQTLTNNMKIDTNLKLKAHIEYLSEAKTAIDTYNKYGLRTDKEIGQEYLDDKRNTLLKEKKALEEYVASEHGNAEEEIKEAKAERARIVLENTQNILETANEDLSELVTIEAAQKTISPLDLSGTQKGTEFHDKLAQLRKNRTAVNRQVEAYDNLIHKRQYLNALPRYIEMMKTIGAAENEEMLQNMHKTLQSVKRNLPITRNTLNKNYQELLVATENAMLDALLKGDAARVSTLVNVQDEIIHDIAEDILQMDRHAFCNLNESELSAEIDNTMPGIKAMVSVGEKLTYYVQSDILREGMTVDQRTMAFDRWMKIAKKLHEQKDYQGFFHVSAALFQANAIARLDSLQVNIDEENKAFFNNEMKAITTRMRLGNEEGSFIPPISEMLHQPVQYQSFIGEYKDTIKAAKQLIERIDFILREGPKNIELALESIATLTKIYKDHPTMTAILVNLKEKLQNFAETKPLNPAYAVLFKEIETLREEIDKNIISPKTEQLQQTQEKLDRFMEQFQKAQALQRKENNAVSLIESKVQEVNPANIARLDQLSFAVQEKGKYSPASSSALSARRRNAEAKVIAKGSEMAYLNLFVNKELRKAIVENGLATKFIRDAKLIDRVNQAAEKIQKDDQFEGHLKNLGLQFDSDTLKKIKRENKQIIYHRSILNPMLAELMRPIINGGGRISTAKHFGFKVATIGKIKEINDAIFTTMDNNKLQNLLEDIGFHFSAEKINEIQKENKRLRDHLKSSWSNEDKLDWLFQNKINYIEKVREFELLASIGETPSVITPKSTMQPTPATLLSKSRENLSKEVNGQNVNSLLTALPKDKINHAFEVMKKLNANFDSFTLRAETSPSKSFKLEKNLYNLITKNIDELTLSLNEVLVPLNKINDEIYKALMKSSPEMAQTFSETLKQYPNVQLSGEIREALRNGILTSQSEVLYLDYLDKVQKMASSYHSYVQRNAKYGFDLEILKGAETPQPRHH